MNLSFTEGNMCSSQTQVISVRVFYEVVVSVYDILQEVVSVRIFIHFYTEQSSYIINIPKYFGKSGLLF